jgi:class 3 adenylate cyclase
MIAEKRFVIPFHDLFALQIAGVERGRIEVSSPCSEWLCSYSRSVSPGVIALLGKSATFWAGLTLQQAGESFVLLEQATHFLRSVPADGRMMRVEASCAGSRERDPLRVDAQVYDADGAVIASEHGVGVIIASSERQKRPIPGAKRILATLLFTDIVGSTEHVGQIGDTRWRSLLDQHGTLIRRQIAEREGTEVDTAGDGFLARFDSPARALECARAVRNAVQRLGIRIRVGVHTGECELQRGKLSGIAVHTAARIQAAAEPDEILVSSTVKDLSTGSTWRFDDRGQHKLKGVPGEWQLYALHAP